MGFNSRAFFRANGLARAGACALALSETGACAATQGLRSAICAGTFPDLRVNRCSAACTPLGGGTGRRHGDVRELPGVACVLARDAQGHESE